MGGECLNSGCVPSKALIAAAGRAQAVREAARFGIGAQEPAVDFDAVRAHVRDAIAAIAPHDSAERFRAWGVEVVDGTASFTGPREFDVAGRRMSAPRIVLATGSKPVIPPIAGLRETQHLTNETVFALAERPERLVVLGAGPIGMEMAQAFRRLGSEVVVVDQGPPLAADDREAVDIVTKRLEAEGVVLRCGVPVVRASTTAAGICVELKGGERIEGSRLLVAVGRRPSLEALRLDVAGVRADEHGIVVDARCRTSASGIYAIGDCRAGPRFTHAAGYEGSLMVMQIGFGLPARVDYAALPRVTYTDPQLLQVGSSEAQARGRPGRIEVRREGFADNDRAVTDADITGFTKIVLRKGKFVGATVVGAGAGDTALPWVMAIAGRKASLWGLSGLIVPYPTRAEITKAVAFAHFESRIFSGRARGWARLVAAWRRRSFAIAGSAAERAART